MPPAPRQLNVLLAAMTTGHPPTAVEITMLSELEADDLAAVTAAWPNLPLAVREHVLEMAKELADDNVDLNFEQLARLALGDESPAVRRRAVAALWENEDRRTATILTQMLRTDPDDQVRSDVASALGRFVLSCELEALDANTGNAAIDALRACAGDATEPLDVRAHAVESLGYRSQPWVETVITDAYYSDERSLRLAGVHAMGNSANERWIEYLQDDAGSDDAELRYEVATAFGTIASEEAVDILGEMLEDEDHEVLLAVISSLGQIGGEEALRYLNEFAEEAPPELRENIDAAIEAATFLSQDNDGGTLLRL